MNRNYLFPWRVAQSFVMWFRIGREDKRAPLLACPPRGASRHPIAVIAYRLGYWSQR